MAADRQPDPVAASGLFRLPLRVAQGFCWALLVVLAIPVLPVAIALEWVEERLYGRAKTVGVLHD